MKKLMISYHYFARKPKCHKSSYSRVALVKITNALTSTEIVKGVQLISSITLKIHNRKISSMSRHTPFVFRDIRVWASAPLYVNKTEILCTCMSTWCWLGSAEAQGYPVKNMYTVQPNRPVG